MKNILYLANLEQKLLFLHELRGQLSDGFWENAKPRGHFEPWSSLDWSSVQIPSDGKVGVSGNDLRFADRNNYDFASKELYKHVGKRMRMLIAIYRCTFPDVAKKVGLNVEHMQDHRRVIEDALREGERLPESYLDYLEVQVNATEPMSKFWKETKQNWNLLGLDRDTIRIIDTNLDATQIKEEFCVYSKQELMKDLQMIKLAFRTPR